MLVGNACLPHSCHDKTSKQIKLTTKGGQEPRGVFCGFFSQEIYLVLYFPSNILPNSYGQPDYVLSAVIGKTAGLSLQTTWEEHSSERCAGAPCRNQSLQKPQHPQPGVHVHREREHREKGRKWKRRSLWLCLERELKKQTETNNLQKTNILLKNYKASSSIGALTVGNWSHG